MNVTHEYGCSAMNKLMEEEFSKGTKLLEVKLKNRRVFAARLDSNRTMFVFKTLFKYDEGLKIRITSVTVSNEAFEAMKHLHLGLNR